MLRFPRDADRCALPATAEVVFGHDVALPPWRHFVLMHSRPRSVSVFENGRVRGFLAEVTALAVSIRRRPSARIAGRSGPLLPESLEGRQRYVELLANLRILAVNRLVNLAARAAA